eukprot:TRINITY_DN11455_c0_g2_i1.p1 TRINITY_DN11455_c0_g2~~TRINITY_DN11455_c0_g2_i1.p1  ORF type:complete len:184 (+),score=23.95 TRINITY_DN11455_c0_g2_i1:249-800(+)
MKTNLSVERETNEIIVGHPSEIGKHPSPVNLYTFVRKTNGLGIRELTLEPKGSLAETEHLSKIIQILEHSDIPSIKLVLNKPEQESSFSSKRVGLALGVRSYSYGGDETLLCGTNTLKNALIMPPVEVVLNCPQFDHPNVRMWNIVNRTTALRVIGLNSNIRSVITDYPAAVAPHCIVRPVTR